MLLCSPEKFGGKRFLLKSIAYNATARSDMFTLPCSNKVCSPELYSSALCNTLPEEPLAPPSKSQTHHAWLCRTLHMGMGSRRNVTYASPLGACSTVVARHRCLQALYAAEGSSTIHEGCLQRAAWPDSLAACGR